MSQIQFAVNGGAPAVPTTFHTDSGDAIPVGNAISIVTPGGGTQGIATSGSGSTITITVADTTLTGTVNTIGAVTGDVITLALGAIPGTYTFDCKITGYDITSSIGAGYTIVGAVRTTGGAAVLIAGQAVDSFEEGALSAGSAALVVNANNAIFRITGTAGETVHWKAEAAYVFIS